ncbi:glycerophosphodiester phosphodiesterase [Lipingzhangella sp. LS1_29]|uniref:Glycerophosphodiester phosphodiesterase n=1 Tax=Lipingzhangella rawalii TaxID=2055835 RepID=A0ABU2H362_9ACTN|nr:glycerophosphodiester phosphodiesterase [Lipingzhangella rawalii]MDS1269742.1 glycerophosphodiester phosphodiesterase [Lipingzhangella rawalii]
MIFDRPEVIGHRGAGRGVVDGARENTTASFHAAVAAGAGWVEVDVRRTRDDALVVYHDEKLPDGRVIVDLTAAECTAAGVATLDEILTALPSEVGIDFDVKTVMEDALCPQHRRTVSLLAPRLREQRDGTRPRRMFVSSFDPSVPLAVRDEAPGVPVAWMPYVRGSIDQALPGAVGMGCDVVCLDARALGVAGADPDPTHRSIGYAVDLAHRAGLAVVSWCPDPVDSVRFVDAGVDAVVVDDVPGTVAALKER